MNTEAINKYFSKRGDFKKPYCEFGDYIKLFYDWYRGDTEWHEYIVWTGEKKVSKHRLTLGMAKTVCEDMARLIGIEKLEIHLNDKKAEKFLNKVWDKNNFRVNASQLLELSFALGTGCFYPSVQGDEIKIDFVHADAIIPLSWDNGEISELAFVSESHKNENAVNTLIVLTKANNGYDVKSVEINKDGEVVSEEMIDNAKENFVEGEYAVSIIKPNIVNNFDKTSPMGMSIYGGAIDILKSIDELFDGMYNEFDNGKKRIFVDSKLKSNLVKQNLGNDCLVSAVDSNETVYHMIEFEDGKAPIYESELTLRVDEYEKGLKILLNLLSKKVGLGENFYTFDRGAVQQTATASIIARGDLFSNVVSQELMFGDAIRKLCRGILSLSNQFMGTNFDVEQDITIDFDDSIIEDTQQIKDNALKEFDAGLIDQIEYFVITRKMTREQATDYYNQMKENVKQRTFQGFIGDL